MPKVKLCAAAESRVSFSALLQVKESMTWGALPALPFRGFGPWSCSGFEALSQQSCRCWGCSYSGFSTLCIILGAVLGCSHQSGWEWIGSTAHTGFWFSLKMSLFFFETLGWNPSLKFTLELLIWAAVLWVLQGCMHWNQDHRQRFSFIYQKISVFLTCPSFVF